MNRLLITGLLALAAAMHAQPLDVHVGVAQSAVIDYEGDVKRVAIADPAIAEAVVISTREVLVNGKKAGATSLIVWMGDTRASYTVHVTPSDTRLQTIRRELADEFGAGKVSLTTEGETVFLRGTVKDLVSADRAAAIGSSLGKVVNLLQVAVPQGDRQVLLKVKFANLSRVAVSELGMNLISTGAANTPGAITTQQFNPPLPKLVQGNDAVFTISDALNIFLFRPDLNLGATIKALQSRRLLEVLAEPNVLAIDGSPASFLAGGEFPYPVVQSVGTGLNAVTILFREFGIRLRFQPTITPRGTIRLHVAPEVSALDYANGLVYQGFQIPGLSVRKVDTEIELKQGQSFAIAGLLDNRLTETLSRVAGLSDIPLLGRLFRSRAVSREKTELLVMVTPELVEPIPAGQPLPEIQMPREFLKEGAQEVPGTPATSTAKPDEPAVLPFEQLKAEQARTTDAKQTR
jgi:pilus assembly protein CpaC